MFKRAFIIKGILTGNVDGLAPADDVYVEHFIPRNHTKESAQIAEYTWIDKALRLWY